MDVMMSKGTERGGMFSCSPLRPTGHGASWRKVRCISSVQFSKAICIAQFRRMSHCAPAARKPVHFKFTPETRVGDVLVA